MVVQPSDATVKEEHVRVKSKKRQGKERELYFVQSYNPGPESSGEPEEASLPGQGRSPTKKKAKLDSSQLGSSEVQQQEVVPRKNLAEVEIAME